MRALIERSAGHEIAGIGVLVGTPMPDWTVEQILSVHIRMHKAEGVLFPAALIAAATACDVKVVAIPEKDLRLDDAVVVTLGKSAGPPWGKDQKSAAMAAMIATTDVHRAAIANARTFVAVN